MGYYTLHNLSVCRYVDGQTFPLRNTELEYHICKAFFKVTDNYFNCDEEMMESTDMIYELDEIISAEECQWYDHQIHMIALSRLFPEVLFTLKGEGENQGDVWNEYYLNGQIQVCKAQIIIPPFDATKLQKGKN